MKKDVEAIYPLSPTQQGMLFHTLLAPQAGEYCQQTTLILQGQLDVVAYQRAWQEVVNRHAILRSLFVWEGQEKPLQVVRRQVQLSWQLGDWRIYSADQQIEQLSAFLHQEQACGFDLKEAPLMRLALFQLAEDRYQFAWTYHHLLLDGWSLPILFEEIFTCYQAFLKGKTIALPRPRPYRDYIAWLQAQDQAQAETFWREQLRGLTSPTSLRIDKPVAEGDAAAYHEHLMALPTTLDAGLRNLAHQNHLTLNTLIQGAWALLLNRYSGQDDVLFGVTVSGRSAPLPDMEKMVGLFINTLPLRVHLTPDQPVINWLQELQANQIQARQFEYSSLVQVQGWSDIPRGRNLFDTILVFENYPISSTARQDEVGLQVHTIKAIERTNYPLTLLAVPGTSFALAIAYDIRRFETKAIERMLGHLQTILAQLVANPQQTLAQVELLTIEEKRAILTTWNDTPVAFDLRPTTLHALLEAQVDRTPNSLALLAPDFQVSQLSYRELDTRANQLARYLQTQGIGPGKIVAFCLDRTSNMAIAILGVLKTGAAYLPLDPQYPLERLQFMLADSQADMLLTQTSSPIATAGVPTFLLDVGWPAINQYSPERLATPVTPDNLAYIIYTSGSTGRPKGVMISHRALVNQTLAAAADYNLQPEDRVLQFAAISFDVLAEELFPTWLRGAATVLYPQQASASLTEFNHFLQQHELTVLNLPAPYWHEWVTALSQSPTDLPLTLRLVIAGSDRVSAEHVALWCNLVGGRVAWRNAYGLTETTITTTLLNDSDLPAELSVVPIGRPMANNQIYLLDDQLRPVPVGVPGELYIGGAGLAQGYLGQPGQTAARFVPNLFSPLPGARMYKTGDQARWTEQGTVVFLGRVDEQVSIRGFRIEPGEIEAILTEQPDIAEAVVMVHPIAGGQLVAYLVARQNKDSAAANLNITEVRQALRRQLPAYMIPSHFVFLTALPLLPNGKVDRQALPLPNESHAAPHDFVAPRNPLEELVAGIWADILNLSRVGVEDDFFALGGHSLLATQMISRLRDTFRLEIPMRALFESPTVTGLAQVITAIRFSAANSATNHQAPPLQPLPEEADRRTTLSFAQNRLWFLHQLEPDSPAYNVPMAVRLTGPLNRQALAQSLATIINRHQVLRTTFPVTSGQPIQVIHPPVAFVFVHNDPSAVAFSWQGNVVEHPLVTLSHLPAAERWARAEQFVKEEGHRPFDLRHDLPIRATLLCLDEEVHVLTMIMHHIASDGWSVSLFTQELATLYQAFCAGLPDPLPPLSVQYVDFAHWQRQWLSGAVMAQQLEYWQKQLAGAPTILDLPTDRPRPRIQTFRGANHLFTLPPNLTEALKTMSRRHGVTLYMTLLAAFQVLLSRYSGQKDILVGSPIANRNHTEVEPLIGFFANTLVLRTQLSGNPTFRDLLKQVRDTTLDAYAHQDLPFEKLVEEVDPTRDLSRSPLFQVMFIFLNIPTEALKLQDLTLAPASFSFDTAKFDLTLAIGETAQGMSGALEYNTDLFDANTITRLVEHFHNLLLDIVADPRRRIVDLSLLSPAERTELLVNWNATQMDVPDVCFHQLFEAQARKTPQNTAVIWGKHSLTYHQLDELANRLAHTLQKQGITLETPVALCLDRSLDMMVALLGVLKAGGTYLPLDPNYPAERLAYMVADAGVGLVLTQTHLTTLLQEAGIPDAVTLFCLDQAEAILQSENPHQPVSLARPHNTAYIIYTSGSTGHPKGVQVLHRSVSNFLVSMSQKPGLTAADKLLAVTTLSFDIAVLELFLPLVTGGQVILASREMAQDGHQLAQAITDYKITAMQATPATWQLLLELGWQGHNHLKILCGGEPLPVELATRLRERSNSLWNMYGPTETTIWSTTHLITPDDDTISIGRPIANTQIYLLDTHLRPVPIGAIGELYIGGTGVARGYWRRPDLTAERFIPNPFSQEPGSRLYWTGDLARYLPDGRLLCLGRVDHQVKVRGYRIELGEIETALEHHPAVRQAVVVACEDIPGDKRLVAYLVPDTHWEQATPTPEVTGEQLTQWQSIWNDTYQQKNGYHEPTFNTAGWKSAYTGQPIPDLEMKEWVNHTVCRLRPLAPRRILEIGCGMGLILFRMAAEVDRYWATDFSQFALDHIETHLPRSLRSTVHLLQQRAHDFAHIEAKAFDLIVLNSVVQYFPTIDYLLDVLEQSLYATASGGAIFIGDVRHLRLQGLFHSGAQLHEAASNVSLTTLCQRIQRRVTEEQELLLDPAFFYALPQRFPQIRHVQVLLKRGQHHNELTKFRYDVVLHVGEPVPTQTISEFHNWRQYYLSLDDISRFLSAEQPPQWGLTQVKNARLCRENAVVAWLEKGDQSGTIREWEQRIPLPVDDGIDPEQLWLLGEELGYEVEITWSDGDATGCFDAAFRQRTSESGVWIAPLARQSAAANEPRPWSTYATNPLQARMRQILIPNLRQSIQTLLPDYMLPTAYVLLDEFPLTPNGKVNRRALPPPDNSRSQKDSGFMAPRTPLEEGLVEIWGQVLGVTRVGVQDNFFELGGHSLLATQVIARVRDTFDIELPLRTLFENPTIAGMAEKMMRQEIAEADETLLAQLLANLT